MRNETGNHNAAVVGAGFAGMAAASILAANSVDVILFEKNELAGGRARRFSSNGFIFDMGPSWYWMPDVFERFYNKFGYTTADFYELKKLDPGFKMIFDKGESIDIPADFDALCILFESIESGSAVKLKKFMMQAEYKYMKGMHDFVFLPGNSIIEYFKFSLLKDSFKLQLFSSFSKHVRSYFKEPRLIALLEFPVLFLGAMPKDTPALYSLMNFAGLKQGTFYPMGGFGKVVDAFETIAKKAGVQFHPSETVDQLEPGNEKMISVQTKKRKIEVDGVIAAADYHHVERNLLSKSMRSYKESYWDKKVFAPSCLIFYLGIDCRIGKLHHHNLFFDADLDLHAREIYESKIWPTKPLFYACCPSKTDATVAPQGCENLFLLMPVAAGIDDTEPLREKYFTILMDRLEKFTGEDIRSHVIFKKSYSVNNFINDYNAYKGNAYGLANTLFQTAIYKPKIKSKKMENLFFAGQLTVPGPGVPPSIISGQIAANELLKNLKIKR